MIQSVSLFFQGSEVFLGVVIILFTLVFPSLKFVFLFWGVLSKPTPFGKKVNKVLSTIGKYSMLDVFVVALLLLNLKFDSDILDMQVRIGVVYFAISIVLTMVVGSLMFHKPEKWEQNPVKEIISKD